MRIKELSQVYIEEHSTEGSFGLLRSASSSGAGQGNGLWNQKAEKNA